MPSVFASNDSPCGIFGGASPCGGGTMYALSHARAAHLLYGAAPVQDARGELHLSFVGMGSISLEMQPEERRILREPHGQVIQIRWRGIATGRTNLRERDRVVFFGYQLEVDSVEPWPDHDEIIYREIGR